MAKPPQARNTIKRALLHVAGIRFSKLYKERCRTRFHATCAYCGLSIEAGSRKGHYDHAIAIASQSNRFHLVYACSTCNGDQKRERDWEGFLREKCGGDEALLQNRKQVILDWFATEPPALLSDRDKQALREAESEALEGFNQAVATLRLKLNTV